MELLEASVSYPRLSQSIQLFFEIQGWHSHGYEEIHINFHSNILTWKQLVLVSDKK